MTARDKHLASSDKRLAPCDKHLACDKRKAFTLLEVLVALAVLAAGAATLSLYLGVFRHISSIEFAHSDSALAAVRYMESQVTALPACADIATNDKTTIFPAITITPVPATSLQWLEIRTPGYTFRRLSRCKKASR